MLRQSLRALGALQRAQAASTGGLAGLAEAGPLVALATALQRLQLCQASPAAAAHLTAQRHFAAAAGGGGGGRRGGAARPPVAAAASGSGVSESPEDDEDDEDGPLELTSESGQLRFADVDEALEAWGQAMDEGDWGRAWDIFEGVAPVEGGDEFPELGELLAWDPDAEEKESRRAREAALKEMHASRWVRRLDPVSGRAYGVGKRKTSVALVWLKPAAANGAGRLMVNRRPYDAYFPDLLRRNDLAAPFQVTDTLGGWDVMVRVNGGGPTGQAQAARMGIARALQNWDPTLRPVLKAAGLLSRDARIVERKKPGLKKARKAFQWVKR